MNHSRGDDDGESSSCASSSVVYSEIIDAKSPIYVRDRKTNGLAAAAAVNGDVMILPEQEDGSRPEGEGVIVAEDDMDVVDNSDAVLAEVSLDGSKGEVAIPPARDQQGDAMNSDEAGDEARGTELSIKDGDEPMAKDEDDVKEVKIGFSFSPGGLLFAYHLGVLASLTDRGYVTDTTPLAGSSAGGIAVATYAAGVNPYDAIASCVRIADECSSKWGGARGRLLPLLERELDLFLPKDAHKIVNERPGLTGIAYREVFPQPKSVLATHFDSREDFIEAICNSSAFPFFSSNNLFVVRRPRKGSSSKAAAPAPPTTPTAGGEDGGSSTASDAPTSEDIGLGGDTSRGTDTAPVPSTPSSLSISNVSSSASDPAVAEPPTKSSRSDEKTTPSAVPSAAAPRRMRFPGLASIPKSLPRLPSAENLPRLVVDGFFSTSRDRFGCPSFPPEANVDRTITVSVFPHHVVGLNASEERDRICPTVRSGQRGVEVMSTLLQKAGIPSSAHEYVDMYECGRVDADRWVAAEIERDHAASAATKA